ncbi:hypothetical protein FACS1894139_05040 [Planctomycetales bacterium]|nr:hypothetical protein FACS1894107_03220 [Planctomycetales bacterium]GHS97051.1 hypothetical protein FACS1894108_02780 [Planctomycetales bacterium]GHT03844.1 hypothetical protein FACS1894139_05040 [Planctomycetales bacterium]GHV18908.1 hypothetical protein AGMMS49959_02080 [Planctomycetales bacterium]
MLDTLPTTYRNPAVVYEQGLAALTKEMGATGMAYFMRQFDPGSGDYTRERREWLSGLTTESFLHEIAATDRQAFFPH